MQESEAQRSGAKARGDVAPKGSGGLLPSIAAMAIMGGICWQWLIPPLANPAPPVLPEGGSISELSPIAPADIPDALGTMSTSSELLARLKKEAADGCPRPLAWFAIVADAGQPATAVRLRSGNYFSPMFKLSNVPTRVAIPYPAPYEAGRGKLIVMGDGGKAEIALQPTWHVALGGAGAARDVTWTPSQRCKLPNG